MYATKRKRNGWKNALEHGDYQRISEKSGYSRQLVSRAFKDGKMPDRLFYVMQDYFKGKKRG